MSERASGRTPDYEVLLDGLVRRYRQPIRLRCDQ